MFTKSLTTAAFHMSYVHPKITSAYPDLTCRRAHRILQLQLFNLPSSFLCSKRNFGGMSSGKDVDVNTCYKQSLQLVRDAGKVILAAIGSREKNTATKSCDTDFVTETDRKVEMLLINGLEAYWDFFFCIFNRKA